MVVRMDGGRTGAPPLKRTSSGDLSSPAGGRLIVSGQETCARGPPLRAETLTFAVCQRRLLSRLGIKKIK